MADKVMAWSLTHSQVYEAVYAAVKDLVSKPSGSIAARIDDAVYFINSPTQVRQGVSVEEVFISTVNGWTPVPTETIDEWAASFGIVGPTDHFAQVDRAIREGRFISSDVAEDFKKWAGLGPTSVRDARKRQTTRVSDKDGRTIGFSAPDKPQAGDKIGYKLPHGNFVNLTVSSVRAYRNFDKSWRVSVAETDEQFVVNLWSNGDCKWLVQTRRV